MRRRRIWASVLVTVAFLPGVVLAVPVPAAAAPVPDCSDTAAVESAALALAKACARPVEVLAARTESSETIANPDGTRTLRTYVEPQRAHRADGTWAKIDRTLQRATDGTVAPVATASDLRLSGGGSTPLITLRRGAAKIALSWPSPLPAPTLNGATATYPEVLPGVDLQVTAELDGFSQVLVVKHKAAAANPALRRVSLKQFSTGVVLRPSANGTIEARDAGGTVVFASSGAFAWDSPSPALLTERRQAIMQAKRVGDAAPADSTEPAPPVHHTAMPVEVTGSELAVRPPATLLEGADTQFPLYIDPAFVGTGYKWTQVNSGSPDSSYWSQSRDYMRVGREYNNSNVWRTFLRFDNLHPLFGQNIISASVFVTLYHSASCAASPANLWTTAFVDDVYTNSWNLTKNAWYSSLQTVSANANKEACPQPNAVMEYGNNNVVNQVRAVTGNGTWHIDLGLRADNEGDKYQWKKFLPTGAHLDVKYNLSPNAPQLQNLSTVTDCYKACGTPATVRTTTPTLSAMVSDPNGGNVKGHFWVRDAAETQVLAGGTVVGTSGNTLSWTVPAGILSPGVTYHWLVIAEDELLYQTFSSSRVFTIDATAPPAPTVGSTQYPVKVWGSPVGTPGTFNLTSAGSDAVEFVWSVDSGASTTTPATGTTTKSASVSYTPTTDMVHTLHVKALDAAGNVTTTYDHQFWVTPSPNRYSRWKFDEASGTTTADSGAGGSSLSPLALSGSVAFGPGYPIAGGTGNGLVFNGGTATTSNGVLDTTKSFTVMAWVKSSDLSSTNGYQTAISQDGVNMSRFVLRYDKDANGGASGWCFGMRVSDVAGTNPVYACATGTVGSSHLPVAGEWVHLAGVYDAVTGVIQIHVMGNQDSCDGEMVQATFNTNWSATGKFAVGRAQVSGATANTWRGSIDDVWAYQRRLDAVEICQQASQ